MVQVFTTHHLYLSSNLAWSIIYLERFYVCAVLGVYRKLNNLQGSVYYSGQNLGKAMVNVLPLINPAHFIRLIQQLFVSGSSLEQVRHQAINQLNLIDGVSLKYTLNTGLIPKVSWALAHQSLGGP